MRALLAAALLALAAMQHLVASTGRLR